MYEKEERELERLKESYNTLDIPMFRLDEAIQIGIEKAKKKKRRKSPMMMTIVAILFLSFLTMIRVSPSVASFIAVLPGMEKIVEMIRDDKGLVDAINNEYLQEIGVSDEHNGIKVTLDSAIVDEEQMIMFYTITSNKSLEDYHFDFSPVLKTRDGKELTPSFIEGGVFNGEDIEEQLEIRFYFEEPLVSDQFLLELVHDKEEETYSLPFTIDREVYKDQKRSFKLNQVVEVEGQKITVKKVDIYPLRTAVYLEYDPNNTMRIFGFEDLNIIKKNGEKWNMNTNGLSATQPSVDELVLYLESNYFHEPSDLFLTFSKVRALDKKELDIKIDSETGELLEAPADSKVYDSSITSSKIIIRIKNEEKLHFADAFTIFNANGEDIKGNTMGMHYLEAEGVQEFYSSYDRSKLVPGPIILKIGDYPATIQGDVKIRIN